MSNQEFKWDIIGHQKIVHFLQKSIAKNKISHAYLFAGPEGVGKTKMAEYLSASLLCGDKKIIPCKQCVFCRQVFKKIHPDLIWIKKEAGKKNVGIEQIRNLRESLSLGSFLNFYKIAIIEEAENLTQEAWNAILKTLEEVAGRIIVILITNNFKNLPATVISRCQTIKFSLVNKREIFNCFLNEFKVPQEKAEFFSRLSRGRPGVGVKFIENEKLLKEYQFKVKSFFEIIKKQKLKDRFDYLNSCVKQEANFLESREKFYDLLSAWILILRDSLLAKTSNSEFVVNVFAREELNRFAENYSLTQIRAFLQKFIQTKNFLYYNVNPRLAIENSILNF